MIMMFLTLFFWFNNVTKIKYIHTYHSRFIPEGVTEVSQKLNTFAELEGINEAEVVSDFRSMLASILQNSEECRGKCELVYFDSECYMFYLMTSFTAGWSSGLRNQRSRVQIPVVSRGFGDEQLHLLTSHGWFYTTCLVHTLLSRNLPMLKGAYKSSVEVRNEKYKKKN
jgi:hypothetical protein